ncbi:ty3-gypsy retrotransposon protein [Tanacetum coccineum]
MKRVSLHRMQSLLEHDEIYGMYEIHSLLMEAEGEDTRIVVTESGHLKLEQLQDRFDSLFNLIAIHTIKNGEMEKLVNEMLSQGHIICGCGVKMDPKKVTVVHEWMEPKTQRQVRGFKWGVQEAKSIVDLKQQLSTAPILGLPDFEQVFVLEADASADRIGAVLLQNNRSISYFIRKLAPRIRPWKLNQVTYTLSRMFEEEESITAAFMSMSQPVVGLLGDLKSENKTLEELLNLHQKIDNGEASEDVCVYFIMGLPSSKRLTIILVVVDHLSKYVHFETLPTSFNAHEVAEVFLYIVIKHHGLPKTIVSDRDPIFLSKFWTQLFQLSGTQLNHSTTYHPQIDRKIEVVNRGLEQYLRAMVSNHPQHWARIMEHKQRVQESLLIQTTYTAYHSRSIRHIQDFDELKDHCLTLKNMSYPHQRYAIYNTLVNKEEPTGFTSCRIHQEDTAYPCPNFTKTSIKRRLNTPYPEAFIRRIERRLINILEYYNRGAYAKYPNTPLKLEKHVGAVRSLTRKLYFEDINYFKDFENEFSAIVYKDALISEPTSCWYSDAFTTHNLAHIRKMEDHTEQISGEFSVLIL